MATDMLLLAAVSLAPLVTWTKVDAACTLLLLLDLLALTVGLRRDPGNRRLTKASLSARKALLSVGPLALITVLWHFSPAGGGARYADLDAVIVTILTVAGWLGVVGTVLTLIGGVYALAVPVGVATGTDERAREPQAYLAAPTPPEARGEAAQGERAAGPGLSPWMEAFLLLNIVDLAVLAATLFVRGPQALPNALTRNPGLNVLISFGGGVLFAAFMAGLFWVWYRFDPRFTRVLLAGMTVLTGLATVYNALHLVGG